MRSKLIQDIFYYIKNEEITIFKIAVGNAISEAISSGQISSSVYIVKLHNLAENSYKSIYNKFLTKLEKDELQSHIKKDSKILINLMNVLLEDIISVITDAHVPSSTSKYNDEAIKRLDETFRQSLITLKDELIDNWNVQAKIELSKNKTGTIEFLKQNVVIAIIGVVIVTVLSPYISKFFVFFLALADK